MDVDQRHGRKIGIGRLGMSKAWIVDDGLWELVKALVPP